MVGMKVACLLTRRVPEEAPQEIADLVLRCTSDADARPDALECAQIINPFCAGGSGRRLSPQSATHSGQRIGQPGQQAGASGQLVQQVGLLTSSLPKYIRHTPRTRLVVSERSR